MTFNETPIDFREAQFTLAESLAVIGCTEATLRTWQKRDQIDLGVLNRRLGRWLFSALDLMHLRTMVDLIDTTGMPVPHANRIGAMVAERFLEIADEPPDSTFRRDLRIIVSLAGGDPIAIRAQWEGETYALPMPARGHDSERFRRPCVVVPADAICFDVADAIFKILESEAR